MRAVWGFTVAILAVAPMAAAQAQGGAGLMAARSDLATYDVSGRRTLDTLRSLGPIAGGGGPDATEARYLRAVAGTDLHVIALASENTALDAQLADALGVPPAQLAAELRSELTAVQTGLYRAVVRDELALLADAERVAGGEVSVTGTGARSAALFVLGVAHASRTRAALSGVHVAGTAPARPAWLVGPDAGLEVPIQEALRREDVATRGTRDGDPLLVALTAPLASAHTALTGFELRVPPSTASMADVAIATGEATGGDAPDVLVVIDATRVLVGCAARGHVTSATELEVHAASAGCPAPGTLHAFALPTSLPAVPQPIDTLVEAFGTLSLPSTAVIAVAPTEAAQMHLLTRVLRSLARASLTPTMFALATSDGALSTSPLALATAADAPPITVHIRLGGFAVARTHGHDATIPRVRGAHGLEPDHAGLRAMAAAETAGTPMAIDAMAPVAAAELIRAARVLGGAGARVSLALP